MAYQSAIQARIAFVEQQQMLAHHIWRGLTDCLSIQPRSNGFTLVEVLVAFVILTLSLGTLMLVFSGGLQSAHVAPGYGTATLLAESKLEAIGIAEPLRQGTSEGRFDDRFRWRMSVEPYDRTLDRNIDLRPYRVALSVTWREDGQARSVTVTTLRLVADD